MRLYFIRHGQAGEAAEWHGPDAERPLTEAGQAEMRRAARGLALLFPERRGHDGYHLYSSPYTRAHQTAEIVANALEMTVETRAELASGCDLTQLAPLISHAADAHGLIFVGHEPDFSDIIGALITPQADELSRARIEMKKGACCCVDLAARIAKDASTSHALAGRGRLVWLLTAKQLTRLVPDDAL